MIDRCLGATDDLMRDARKLPGHLVSHRLAMESGIIVKIAQKLIRKLRYQDPVAGRVKLSKGEYILCGVFGALRGLFS